MLILTIFANIIQYMPIAVFVVFPWENVYLQDLRQAPAQECAQRVAFHGKLNDTCCLDIAAIAPCR